MMNFFVVEGREYFWCGTWLFIGVAWIPVLAVLFAWLIWPWLKREWKMWKEFRDGQ